MNDLKNKQHSLKGLSFIDLFAGIGGFHTALASFGAECVFASEWDKHAQKTYQMNYQLEPVGDITKIDANDIPMHDILCAGFPCQPFSISGKRHGFDDTRGTLFFDVARIVRTHQPKLLFMENVRNFATHDNGNTLITVKETLDELGYTLFHQVLNASHFGLPQNRERIYMIAFRQDLNVQAFTFPSPTYQRVILHDLILSDEETAPYRIHRDDQLLHLEKVPVGPHWQVEHLRPLRVGTFNKGGQGERIYSEFGHAITLSAQGGGPGSKTGCYLINDYVRKLAPRECARIQGFPDSFQIPVSDGQAWKQFGNSVPVYVLQAILEAIINQGLLPQLDEPILIKK
ncbi:DNA cytosine methyltransferase [Alkalihalobacillus pseudalcaliphilus]|uniref:DNA cytosine methyltransferase n=1 Tax=Alkalihalobacillus pseudalcaliphilus TaxID=79884 RepID=UPI00064DE961|nr:DNA cytosine methyltransferase [Alkalihalobacillus pseudalcaliphilus]KMK75120.1 modification methylase [Alkalihalobacillus pseudalcaliphilus]